MKKISVGIFGFGKTGKEVVRQFLSDPLFEVRWVVRKTEQDKGKFASRLLGFEYDSAKIFCVSCVSKQFYDKYPVDIIVDFSSAESYKFYEMAADKGIKIISAVSKYSPKDIGQLKSYAKQTAVLYSPNITLGINFLLVISQVLQKVAPHADIEIVEEHFRNKPEVSGTALKIARILNLKKNKHVNSIRAGGIIGKHEVIFGLPNQTIRLVHESISKAAFGQGALFAAKWIINQAKGLFSMEYIITDMFKRNIPVY